MHEHHLTSGPFHRRVTRAAAVLALTAMACWWGAPVRGASPAEAPVVGQREVLTLISGTVSVKTKGSQAFAPLVGTLAVPDGSEVETTQGKVRVTVGSLEAGQTLTALAYGGRFVLHQEACPPAKTSFKLSAPLPGCETSRRRRGHRARVASPQGGPRGKAKGAKTRQVFVHDQAAGEHFETDARHVIAGARGTQWLTRDECRRSEVRVSEGVVIVHDLIRGTTTAVTAGHRYVAAVQAREGQALVPPLGDVYTGVTGGSSSAFGREVGKYPAVFGYFATWNGSLSAPISEARFNHERLLLHISTDRGYGTGAGEEISPGAIAQGEGDEYLLGLAQALTRAGEPAYIALLPEMNQANNAYSAFNPDGSSRGGAHSTNAYRQAWRRSVLILRGGSVAKIDSRLHALGLPAVQTSEQTLPQPRISFLWAPQTAGTPDIPANGPAAYYPGSAYVDIVGTDFYSAFPNFAGLASLYAEYHTKPFGFNEWAMWKSGSPSFVSQLFAFVHSHKRIALMVYNQGLNPTGPFHLEHFPEAKNAIRRQLASPRFLSQTPESPLKADGEFSGPHPEEPLQPSSPRRRR
ncbi:MAG: glycoside hydrolase family 26 protein [Solirubrobacteraceae bacterium]